MAYVSLYRRYRPQTFADVVGQDHVTATLAHALEEGRLHHAYLFTGPRGTGKTSTARILAKAVNCEQGPTATPCNACDLCVAITDGSSVDVIELDMASHGGVDDARELRERALFAPAQARRKVYILDEVHMASTAAFNALLKLIEEPPAHVLFAMATTDPQKVLPTILSRVQRLDLRRVAAATVAEHVRTIAAQEGFAIAADAVDAVVRAGDGSVRDTLSVLEQVRAYATDGEVTGEDVARVLGHTPLERTLEAVDRIVAADAAGALALVQDLLDGGHDLRRFALDLAGHLRDLLVAQVAPDRPDLVDATDERRAAIQHQAGRLPRETLLRAVDLLAGALLEMRQGPPRLPLELVLAKLTLPAGGSAAAVVAETVAAEPAAPAEAEVVEEAAAEAPAPVGPPQPAEAPAPVGPPQPAEAAEPVATTPAAPAEPRAAAPTEGGDDLAAVVAKWPEVLERLRRRSMRVHAIVAEGTPVEVAGGILTLAYEPRHADFHAAEATRGIYAEALQEEIARACGLTLRVQTTVRENARPAAAAAKATEATAEASPLDEPVEEPANEAAAAQRAAALLRDQFGAEVVE